MPRVLPDGYDVVVWELNDSGTTFVNDGTAGSSGDLTLQGPGFIQQQPSMFGTQEALYCLGTDNASPRSTLYGADTIELNYPITVSGWLFNRTIVSNFTQHIITKQRQTGVWSGGTFGAITIQNRRYDSDPEGWDFFVVVNSGSTTLNAQVSKENGIPRNAWSHIGLTYDGYQITAYINGNIVSKAFLTSGTADIFYDTGGPWFFNAIPAGSGEPEDTRGSLCDWRISNIVRDQNYFENIYREGQLKASPVNVFYKLRSYDTTCSSPTPVYWISQTVGFGDAPPLTCGGSWGPIEIVQKWEIV